MGSLWLAAAMLAVAGAADSVSAVCRSTINQSVTPDRMRGRMSSVYGLVVSGGPRLGDIESGTVASAAGVRFSIVSGRPAVPPGRRHDHPGVPAAGALLHRRLARPGGRPSRLKCAPPVWCCPNQNATNPRAHEANSSLAVAKARHAPQHPRQGQHADCCNLTNDQVASSFIEPAVSLPVRAGGQQQLWRFSAGAAHDLKASRGPNVTLSSLPVVLRLMRGLGLGSSAPESSCARVFEDVRVARRLRLGGR